MRRTSKQLTASQAYAVEIERFEQRLAALRERVLSFSDCRDANWGHVGSVQYANDQLENALNHFVPEGEPIFSTMIGADGKRIRICIPGRD